MVNKEKLFSVLKFDFGLKDNHIVILEALMKKDMTAEELVKNTKIPKGRIYDFLNELMDEGIVDKRFSVPAVYSIDNLSNSMLNFISLKYRKLATHKTELFESLGGSKKITDILVVNSVSDRYNAITELGPGSDNFYLIRKYPLIARPFWPTDPKEKEKYIMHFYDAQMRERLKVDKSVSALYEKLYWEGMKEGRGYNYIVTRELFDWFFDGVKKKFGAQAAKVRAREILSLMDKYNLRIYITDVKNPESIIVAENYVLMDLHSISHYNGILIKDRDIADYFKGYYDEVLAGAEDARGYLKKIS